MNVRYLSVLFGGDDSFDTDMGYQGKGQYLFTMLGSQGDHGTEMDSQAGSDHDAQPRSHPAFYSMTIIGGGASGRTGELMHLNDGTGGSFGNLILTNPSDNGVKFDDCGSQVLITQTVQSASATNYLYFSDKNIIHGVPSTAVPLLADSDCTVANTAAMSVVTSDPKIAGGFLETSSVPVDPRPACNGPAYSNLEPTSALPTGIAATTYKGAFGSTNWLDGWSIMNTPLQAGFVSSTYTCPAAGTSSPVTLCGDITTDTTW